jgi:hypothetical protein
LVFALSLQAGCVAVQMQRDYGEVEIFCYPGEQIFLETKPKTASVEVRAPAEITGIKQAVEQKLTQKGLQVVDAPERADISYEVVLSDASVQQTSAADVRRPGGSLAAHSLGAGTGISTLGGGGLAGVGIGTAAFFVSGSLANATVNKWVTLNDLRIRADVLVREKLPAQNQKGKAAAAAATSGDVFHQTYIVVRAQKVNLKWEECAVEVKARLVKEITAAI